MDEKVPWAVNTDPEMEVIGNGFRMILKFHSKVLILISVRRGKIIEISIITIRSTGGFHAPSTNVRVE